MSKSNRRAASLPQSAIAVCADPPQEPRLAATAAKLAAELGLKRIDSSDRPGDVAMLLTVVPSRLELRLVGQRGLPVFADLPKLDTRSPAGRTLRQPLARALGLKRRSDPPLKVIDATAGWGEDTWLMASIGCHVLAIERNGIVAAMLHDALVRAAVADQSTAARISVLTDDAADVLRTVSARPDVVYLDPMYPAGRKTAERKAMKVLRSLVGADDDAAELLTAAVAVARRRVVVKRPLRAEPLGGKPTHSHRGKALRYDVYAC